MNPIFNIILEFQKIPLKIMGFGINRKTFSCYKKNETFVAENSSRNTFFYLLFFGMLSIFIFSGFLMLLQGEPMSTGLIIVGFIIHPLFGIIGLRKFLWLINGKEILKIDTEKLTIEKNGTFWTKIKTYELKNIKDVISKYETKTYLSQPKKFADNYLAIKELQRIFLFFTIGEIEFKHNHDKIRLFNDLKGEERELIITEIKNYLQQCV